MVRPTPTFSTQRLERNMSFTLYQLRRLPNDRSQLLDVNRRYTTGTLTSQL
ncbi:hypothetical protein Csa_002737 [Cucumis sativus]|uniref:Uncharacterized protein n=1 Tax=Cucumis sativus TaxID=3659 RepID=A0A0A0KKY3_CUCSA|nr:hypothetical protein Csa_002737 [Cucumis sativus]